MPKNSCKKDKAPTELVGLLGTVFGPPAVPLEHVVAALQELETLHQVMDALGVPYGDLPSRLESWARRWLRQMGEASQTKIATEARVIIKGLKKPIG